MKTYIWAQDTGHAWLAVKKAELEKLNIAHKISNFSFVKGSTVYLEEDADAPQFINAYKSKFGVEPKTKEGKTWDRNPCRSFARYEAGTTPAPAPQPTATNVRHLNDYMDQRTKWMEIFNKPGYSFPLTQEMANDIASQLDGDLSPENLHCDGEISHSQAMAKYRFYKLVAQELEAYCKSNGLSMPQLYEL
jgi:hypothetical protein